jgi:hypothetical protein
MAKRELFAFVRIIERMLRMRTRTSLLPSPTLRANALVDERSEARARAIIR